MYNYAYNMLVSFALARVEGHHFDTRINLLHVFTHHRIGLSHGGITYFIRHVHLSFNVDSKA